MEKSYKMQQITLIKENKMSRKKFSFRHKMKCPSISISWYVSIVVGVEKLRLHPVQLILVYLTLLYELMVLGLLGKLLVLVVLAAIVPSLLLP